MPKIEPRNKTVQNLQGLHLYHAGWSNCSMRVRMTLEEKGLDWTSHHLDTRHGEHITPEYFGIHPKGLVPALVHDGNVWIESGDIIQYLDEAYPKPRLTPGDESGIELLSRWMRLASGIHITAVKTYIYGTREKSKRAKSAHELQRYRELQRDEELLEFHSRMASNEGPTDQDLNNAEQLLQGAFAELEEHLSACQWLAGESFSLADITWVPLHYTLKRAGFPFDQYANLMLWADEIETRPSHKKAVVQWFNGPVAGG